MSMSDQLLNDITLKIGRDGVIETADVVPPPRREPLNLLASKSEAEHVGDVRMIVSM
jgi:hypothetical protein